MTRRRGGRRLCDEAGEERDIWVADEGGRYKVMTARVKQSRCALAFSGRPPDAKWRQFLLFAVLPSFFSSLLPWESCPTISIIVILRRPSHLAFFLLVYTRELHLSLGSHCTQLPDLFIFFCSRGRQLYDGVQITTLSHDDGGSFAAGFFGGTAQLCLRCRALCQLKWTSIFLFCIGMG